MDNLSLYSSSHKPILGLKPNPQKDANIITKPSFCFFKTAKRNSLFKSRSVVSAVGQHPGSNPSSVTKFNERLSKDCFARISSSSTQHTTSVGTPQMPVPPPPPSQVGSPLFWVGVGVAFSAAFSWTASYLKKAAMQQAFKTMMGQMDTQNNQFANAGFSSGSPFPFPTPGAPGSSPFPFPPPSQPTSASATSSSGPASRRTLTVDVPPTKTEPTPPTKTEPTPAPTPQPAPVPTSSESDFESVQEPKKSAFVDVSPEETLKTSFDKVEESTETESPKESEYANQAKAFQNGAAFDPPMDNPFQGASSSGKGAAGPVMSVEALEKMMEDPTVQKMVYPYLPEEMRNPTSFKWMLQNPQYRQQLQDMLNSMGGSPEWDNRMMDSLKNFDISSPEVKEQFDQIGLTPEEVISKIMANPDVAMAFQNPRVQAAIMDCSQNPMSIMKYQNDKEVMDVFNKISELFPGVTGAP